MGPVNHLAVLAIVIFRMALGFVWYAESAFGTAWMRGVGLSAEDVANPSPLLFVFAIAASVSVTYLMALILNGVGAVTGSKGLLWGLLIGVGIVAITLAMHHSFALSPLPVIAIEAGQEILSLAVTGLVLGAWRRREAAA